MVAAKKVEQKEVLPEVSVPDWERTVWEPLEQPLCPRCGSKTIKKGAQVYSHVPHKRQKYQCVVCGKTVCPHPPVVAEVKK
jgi:DNA-directed RNA polymerase subunit RPC12/RpoP